jgi:tape measure domain-containing protein
LSEIIIGDVVARIRADATQFQQGIQAATQALTQFQQALQQQASTVQPSVTRTSQAFQQLSQQLTLLNQQAISQTGFLGQMAFSLDKVTDALGKTGTAARDAGAQAQRFGTAWQGALQVAAGIGLATTIQGLIRAFTQFTTESVQLAAKMQDLHRSFVALEGSSGAANRTMAFLFETARRAGVAFTDLAEGYRRLEAASKGTVLTNEDLQRVMTGLTAGFRALGISGEQGRSAIVALEQMLTKGKLSSEELVRQLGNAVPGGLGIMAQGLRTTTADLRIMAEAGIVPVSTAVVAFAERMKEIGNTAGPIESMSKTFADLANETLAWKAALGAVLTEVLKPILDDVVKLSQELRALMGIRGPGQQPTPGASTGGGLFAVPWAPRTLGMPAPGTYGPTEQPGAAYVPPGGLPMAPSRFSDLITQAAQEFKIDAGLLSQLIRQESRFDPTAVSKAGAVGLAQIMPKTAEYLQPGIGMEQLKDPATSIRLGAKYLAEQLTIFHDSTDQIRLALAAYNAGPGKVGTALAAAAAAGKPETFASIAASLKPETQAYVPGVLSLGTGPDAQAAALGAEAQAHVQKITQEQVKQTLAEFQALQVQVDNLVKSGDNFNNVLGKDINQEASRLVDKFTDIAAFFARAPQAAGQMGEALQQQVTEATKAAVQWQATLGLDIQRRDMLKQQTEQIAQATIARQAEIVAMRQGQQEAEQFTRLETARLQQARLAERGALAGMTPQQQIALYENRLVDLQNRFQAFGNQIEAQRAQMLRPQFEAELQRVETFMGRPGMSLAQQAQANVLQQAAGMRAQLEKAITELAKHPALQDLREQFQNALQGLAEAAARESQSAYDHVANQTRLRVEAIGDQIEQLGERMKGAGLDPLQGALAAIRREFTGMVNQLDALQRALEELAKTAPQEQQEAIAGTLAAIAAAREDAPEAQDRREAQARFRLELLPRLEEPRLQAEELDAMQNQLEDQRIQLLNQQQGPFGFGRVQTRQERQQMERFTPENRLDAEKLQAQLRAQERLNYAAGLFVEVGNSVGSAWSNALMSIADGTATVSEAFRAMAQSIMQSLAQIASQEAWKAFISLGLRLVFGAAAGAATGGMGGAAGGGLETTFASGGMGEASLGAGINPIMFQHGGAVNRPTLAMLGEHGQPEAVVNQGQMNRMMSEAVSRAPSAGGQAVSIHNYPSKAEAEVGASRERALGHAAVINEVMTDLKRGESSLINRTLRTLQR